MKKPLVHNQYLLEKFPGKGGWTYAVIPEILPDKTAHFGAVKVYGNIDGYELRNYTLMPLGKGKLFLSVNAAIRKQIGKSAGDYVTIILYAENDIGDAAEELLQCLLDDPTAHKAFLSYTKAEQKAFIDWISAANTMEKKVERITQTLNKLSNGQKFS